MKRWQTLATLVATALACAAAALLPHAAHAEAADIAAAARGVVRVVIVGRDGDQIYPVSHGTGFAVGGDRIVTNAHVVADLATNADLAIGVVPPEGGEAVYARLVAVSQRNDLALLETTVPLGLPALTIAGNPATSGAVTAIGYPQNVDRAQGLDAADIFRAVPPVTSTGFLSGRRPSVEFDTLLHTAPIARGNSGGPLVDDCGRLVGVNSFGADSDATEAEFFFAISTRELLPFLRANAVAARINSAPCRSLAEVNAAETARTAREQAEDAARMAEEEAALARQTDDLRRTATYAVLDERANLTALALLAFVIALGAGAVGGFAHSTDRAKLRAIAASIAGLALAGAVAAWFVRPPFSDIDSRVEEALRAQSDEPRVGAIEPQAARQSASEGAATTPLSASGNTSGNARAAAASLICTLDPERSRVVSAPEDDVALAWTGNGCEAGTHQYASDGSQWVRVFVAANEPTVSVNRYDSGSRELVVDRYLLDRAAMQTARAARAGYEAPRCTASAAARRALGNAQGAVLNALPQAPNERLVYRCRAASGGN